MNHPTIFLTSAALAAAAITLGGCPAGKAADTVKSDQPKASKGPVEAGTKEMSCEPGKNYEALAVDWDPEMRGDLEVAMKQGTVLIEYTCDKLAILDDCTAEGGYGFLGMSRKEKVVQMKDADEIKANLPLHGVKWVADAKVGMERGTSLNVAMMMIGMRKSARPAIGRDELTGDCEGATHYVSAATLGAFVMATGSAAKVEAAASFFGKGAEGGSSSAQEVHNKDGSIEDCMKASPSAKAPPEQCAAVVRLKMKALKESGKAAFAAAADDGEQGGEGDAISCPGDLVYADGACTADTSAPHQCAPGDAKSCKAQCDAGDASSCSILGSMYWTGNGTDKDWNKSTALHELGCEKGSARSCRYAGRAYRTGQGAKKNDTKASALLTRGCEAADGLACVELGLLAAAKKDGDVALGMFRKACYGGEYEGCSQIGVMYANGEGGLRKSPKLAVKFFEKGCKEGSPLACTKLAEALATGSGIKKDKAAAAALYEKTCNRGYVDACGK